MIERGIKLEFDSVKFGQDWK